MNKISIFYIFLGICGVFSLFTGLVYILALIAPHHSVKAWVDAFFRIFVFLPQSIKSGTGYVLKRIIYFINWTNRSFGIHSEGGQRITGTIIYFFITCLSIFASFLILVVTFDAIFGDGRSIVLEYLPEYLNIEMIMAAELIFATILFGLVLFDILGITDLHMYFSPKHISKNIRYALGGGAILCIVLCIWLLGLTGNIRYFGASTDINQQTTANEVIAASPHGTDTLGQEQSDVPPSYARSVKALMYFVPMIAGAATFYGITGCLPILNFIMIAVVFIVSMFVFGPVWVLGYIADGITTGICEFLKGLLYIVIDCVASKNKDKAEKKACSIPLVPAIPVNGNGKERAIHL